MQPDKALQLTMEKITDLLTLVEDELKDPSKSEKPLSPEIEEMVRIVEAQVEAYRLLYLKTLKDANIDDKEIQKRIAEVPKESKKKEERLLTRLGQVKEEILTRRQMLLPYVKKAKQTKLTLKQKKRVRKKKFRGLGSRGKWKKL